MYPTLAVEGNWGEKLLCEEPIGFFRRDKWAFGGGERAIRKFVMMFVYAGAGSFSVFFIAVKLPQREDLW